MYINLGQTAVILPEWLFVIFSLLMLMCLQQVDKILIGQISVDSKADWETLQNMICDTFKVSEKCIMYCHIAAGVL